MATDDELENRFDAHSIEPQLLHCRIQNQWQHPDTCNRIVYIVQQELKGGFKHTFPDLVCNGWDPAATIYDV